MNEKKLKPRVSHDAWARERQAHVGLWGPIRISLVLELQRSALRRTRSAVGLRFRLLYLVHNATTTLHLA
jgi:hypothetical protein